MLLRLMLLSSVSMPVLSRAAAVDVPMLGRALFRSARRSDVAGLWIKWQAVNLTVRHARRAGPRRGWPG